VCSLKTALAGAGEGREVRAEMNELFRERVDEAPGEVLLEPSCPSGLGEEARHTTRATAIEAWRKPAPFGESEEKQGSPMGERDVLRDGVGNHGAHERRSRRYADEAAGRGSVFSSCLRVRGKTSEPLEVTKRGHPGDRVDDESRCDGSRHPSG
jgi:hypothetical protein